MSNAEQSELEISQPSELVVPEFSLNALEALGTLESILSNPDAIKQIVQILDEGANLYPKTEAFLHERQQLIPQKKSILGQTPAHLRVEWDEATKEQAQALVDQLEIDRNTNPLTELLKEIRTTTQQAMEAVEKALIDVREHRVKNTTTLVSQATLDEKWSAVIPKTNKVSFLWGAYSSEKVVPFNASGSRHVEIQGETPIPLPPIAGESLLLRSLGQISETSHQFSEILNKLPALTSQLLDNLDLRPIKVGGDLSRVETSVMYLNEYLNVVLSQSPLIGVLAAATVERELRKLQSTLDFAWSSGPDYKPRGIKTGISKALIQPYSLLNIVETEHMGWGTERDKRNRPVALLKQVED